MVNISMPSITLVKGVDAYRVRIHGDGWSYEYFTHQSYHNPHDAKAALSEWRSEYSSHVKRIKGGAHAYHIMSQVRIFDEAFKSYVSIG